MFRPVHLSYTKRVAGRATRRYDIPTSSGNGFVCLVAHFEVLMHVAIASFACTLYISDALVFFHSMAEVFTVVEVIGWRLVAAL